MKFATNLRYLRKKYGYSQDFIANKLGYKSYTTIQKWESGDSEPNYAKLKYLADLFGVSIDDLVNSELSQNNHLVSNDIHISEELTKLLANENIVTLLDKLSLLNDDQLNFVSTVVDTILKKNNII